MTYPRNVITITGIMPDNVFPIASSNTDPTSVYLYYRTDGKLYLYDLVTLLEYDIFDMPFDDTVHACIIHPFNHT